VYIIYIYIYASAGGKEVLWSDTVGFIQKLPTKLVSSFRATLEELEDASLVLN
jgi:GTP-binding protein HflX